MLGRGKKNMFTSFTIEKGSFDTENITYTLTCYIILTSKALKIDRFEVWLIFLRSKYFGGLLLAKIEKYRKYFLYTLKIWQKELFNVKINVVPWSIMVNNIQGDIFAIYDRVTLYH